MSRFVTQSVAMVAAIFVVSGMLTATLGAPSMYEVAMVDFAVLA